MPDVRVGSTASVAQRLGRVRLSLNSDLEADIPGRRFRATTRNSIDRPMHCELQASLSNWLRLLQCEPEFRDERGAAPSRSETFGISYGVDASARPGIGITRKNETILS